MDSSEPFLDLASRFTGNPGTVLLMSGGDLDCARYHILATRPWLTFTGRHCDLQLACSGSKLDLSADPFDTLEWILKSCRIDHPEIPVPVAAGLFGYLAYDLKDRLEELPRTSIDALGLPHICLYAPSVILIHDKQEGIRRLMIPSRAVKGESLFQKDLEYCRQVLKEPLPPASSYHGDAGGFRSNFVRSDYLKSVQKIIDYIAAGDVYQVNMSQRFDMDFSGDPFSLFKALYQANPAPFFAYIHAGHHQIVSTSPERFILRSGIRVETRPIKGTRPRGKTKDDDDRNRLELEESRKDDAELSMIVDLLRNDIGKVCEGGSVRVAEHKRLEAYQNVYHLVSVVDGQLQEGKSSVDLIKATFPGGSITGCPKVRTMEIIDELEPHPRHIYTGSIGYVSFHDTMDLSIAIRTATVFQGKITFSVGGGIVFDSDPEDEYEETLHKGHTLMSVFGGTKMPSKAEEAAWFNGLLRPVSEARIPATSYGFQYGYGFFETIRVDRGCPAYLDAHVSRFNRAWEHLFHAAPPDVTWEEVIRQVITHNRLDRQTAAVKLLAAKDSADPATNDYRLLVMSRPYTHRLADRRREGLDLALYPEPRQSPLADHKTLNYLYYLQAGNWAKDRGMDEAVILNPDGTISETNTANILLIKGKDAISPRSSHVLPGIMANVVSDLLAEWGYCLKVERIGPKGLFEMDQVILTNSLMGAVPAFSIDGKPLPSPDDLWRRINRTVL